MTIHCECSHCNVKLNLPARLAGSKARCPKCKAGFQIPAAVGAEQSKEPPAPPSDSEREPPIDPPAQPATNEPINEPTLPVAQAIPLDPSTAAVPMATPVMAADAMPGVEAVSPVSRIRQRKTGLQGMMGFLLGLFALLGCLAILGTVAFWLSTRGPQNGTVVIDIPVENRSDCFLCVYAGDRKISRIGPIELLLAKGAHEIELRRLGYEPLKMQVLVAARKELPIIPKWIPVAEAEESPNPPEPEKPPRPEPLDPVEAALGTRVGE